VLAIDPVSTNVYVAGLTTSTDFVGVTGGIQETLNGNYDIYVAVFDSTLAAGPTAPDVSVTPLSHSFGDLEVGLTSAPAVFTLSNTGSADLTVSGITNSNVTDFSINTSGGAAGCGDTFVLAPGASCTFSAAFTPASQGDHSATVTINSDDPDEGSLQVALSGTGLPVSAGNPDISVTPLTYNFGDVEVGMTATEESFTVINNGSADLNVTSIGNSNTTDYTVNTSGGTSGCGDVFTLASAASCTFTVSFTPASQGELVTTVTISSNDPDESALDVALRGSGTEAGGTGGGGGGGGGACFIDQLMR
jgi:hypothetical protein